MSQGDAHAGSSACEDAEESCDAHAGSEVFDFDAEAKKILAQVKDGTLSEVSAEALLKVAEARKMQEIALSYDVARKSLKSSVKL